MIFRKKENYNDYIKLLNKRIFWDMQVDKLDYKRNKDLIIERIAVYGTENDEKIMNKIYSLNTIKKNLIKSVSLTEKVMQYYAFILGIKEKKFKCYTRLPVQMTF